MFIVAVALFRAILEAERMFDESLRMEASWIIVRCGIVENAI